MALELTKACKSDLFMEAGVFSWVNVQTALTIIASTDIPIAHIAFLLADLDAALAS